MLIVVHILQQPVKIALVERILHGVMETVNGIRYKTNVMLERIDCLPKTTVSKKIFKC